MTQENGVGFEEGKNSVMVAGNESFTGYDLPLMAYIASDNDINIGLEVDNSLVAAFNSKYGTAFKYIIRYWTWKRGRPWVYWVRS